MNKKRGVVVLVLLALFLLLINLVEAIDGCYYDPASDLYCEYVSDTEAVNKEYFSPGESCSEIEECEIVLCTVTCDEITRSECEELGGQEIDEVNVLFNDWCSSGCCKAGPEFCRWIDVGGKRWECEEAAASLGISVDFWITKSVDLEMDRDKCEQVCGLEVLPATLKGYVLDNESKPIPGARLEIEGIGTDTTGADGKYEFGELSPNTYLVRVSKEGFVSVSESISLGINETLEFDFILREALGVVELSGYVKDSEGNPIEGAMVSWTGPTGDHTLTDDLGFYKAEGLVLGEYTFTASKYGYATEEELVVISETARTNDFVLEKARLQGIKGKVFVDREGDGEGDYEVYGANIYVDDIFRGYSQYFPLGYYEVSLGVGEHKIYATYYDFELKDKVKFTITEGETKMQDLVLTKYIGECSIDGANPNKAVEEFSAKHVLGEEKVKLEWSKPCPEVSGYNIYKEGVFLDSFSPADFYFVDGEVEWGESYTYGIVAVYTDVTPRESAVTEAAITLGDKGCEGKYHKIGGWELFCLVGAEERKIIWTCSDENKQILSSDCGDLDEPERAYFCAEVGETNAVCKDTGACAWYFQEADPFGLYYEKEKCYGTDNENYCYYDYTNTIVDRCGSCTEVSSCFDYKSNSSCETNNCLGTDCKWIDGADQSIIDYSLIFPNLVLPELVTSETGHGYCVEENYGQDDKCSLCGPEAGLFENYFCTAEVCSGLGRCFSADKLERCEACGERPGPERNCYSYDMELECVGGAGEAGLTNNFGEITLSEDRCGWGRCRWDGVSGGAGTCIKDGDGDGVSDCEGLMGQQACRADNQAPTTKIVPEGVNIVSYAHPSLTFQGVDEESKMGVLGYCLDSANPSVARCIDFEEVSYPGRLKAEEIVLDLINNTLKNKTIPGETYRLRYYSKDGYDNQESAKEAFIFVDTELPQFEISEEMTTVADRTDLTVYLTGLNEPIDCSFELKPILPLGDVLTETVGREETEKEVLFEGLNGVIYNLSVSCEDDYGNVKNETKKYIFDLVEEINIIYPKGAVGEKSIAFEVETLVGASCELYETATGNKIADFISEDEERKHHKTDSIPGFVHRNYQGDYKVVCKELLTQEIFEDYFDFVVDLLGPETEVILQEGNRIVKVSGEGWEKYFVKSVLVSFDCPGEGFACDKTYYCLTDKDYESKISPCYKEFTGAFVLNESTNICYYSNDLGGNLVYPDCGSILVEGMGITLFNPNEYYYQGEKWGISKEAVFDWEIITKVPTQECKFGWNELFDYEKVPEQREFEEISESYYVIERFPEEVVGASDYDEEGGVKTVYVKCKDMEGMVGPVQKFNLEYDPSAPEIEDAYAEPDPVNEGTETTVKVETDDKTLCRFDEGQKEYVTMGYPGEEGNILEIMHNYVYSFGFDGASKLYNMTAQCKNGARDLSEVENFTFLVDYSALGNIMGRYVCVGEDCYKIEDGVYVASKDVVIRVLTNKNAQCSYDGKVFEATGGTDHTQAITGLSEKEHIYLVNCKIGEEEREGQIKFTVDLTPPVVNEVKDGNISCSLDETPSVFVYTNEEAMGGYYYELYDRGNKTSGAGTLIKNGTVGAEIPFKIEVDLVENHTYYFKVGGGDAAGNWGGLKESDGFRAVPDSYEICEKDEEAPIVSFVINETCTKAEVEMYWDDETSCKVFDYEKSFVSNSCEATKSYVGQKILFEETGWICYYVEDGKGNNKTGIKKIEFQDEDGDGIADSCDECPETGAGKVVDEMGCASGQVSDEEEERDTDGDGLPDYWEQLYDAAGCELDWTNDDSNFDGVYDTDEDYDNDEYNNYEEYKIGYDPCVADAPPEALECTMDADCFGDEVCEEGVCVSALTFVAPPAEKPKTLAWVLFILGLLMVLGGSGYLIYYYKFRPRVPARAPPARIPGVARPAVEKPKVGLKERLLALRKTREEKTKARGREALFGAFSRTSKEIPHVEKAIRKEPSVKNLGELAKEHVKVKEMVEPGLKHGERGVFAKLEAIADKTKEKKIEEVVSKKEAKNIFDKLKEISKKRKGE